MQRLISFLVIIIVLTACSPEAPTTTIVPTVMPDVVITPVSPTSTSPPLETPTAAPLNVSPDVKAVLDAQKAPYTVDAQGNAVVDLQDTATQEKIVLNKITDTKTNDGLAKDIVTGYDKDGNRFVYVENYGWVKDMDLASSSLKKEINIPYSWTIKNADGDTVLNRILAIHYNDVANSANPPFSKDTVRPYYGINVMGPNNVFISLQAIHSQMDGTSIYGPLHATRFSVPKKPYAMMGYLQKTASDGTVTHILAQTRLNPDDNVTKPDQVINILLNLDDASFRKLMEKSPDGIPFLQAFIDNNSEELAPQIDLSKDLSLFPPDVQQNVTKIVDLFNAGKDPGQISVPLLSLPSNFATHDWNAKFEPWTYFPPKN